ncbi:hypothetical protein BG842_04620 [Haladaptatus sp. W1]|uniref:hypothetical protein n=1 Tax=unclassified Haladaptatus TaxID=2622732 RepID=UPI00084981E2|nr:MULTISPECIES: hypothetical protein [unclassified Haladaptatus]ODR79974.1 hypothetical protein BG842_04620 [Haladaptatus sp. W1]GKZ13454.1 hypothetical protein HAL_13350 [Haladaptatus sp. T7]
MNKLAAVGDEEGRWHLPQHAHVIVYEAERGDQLLTIYDCGAAQKPPSAQVIGNLVRIRAAHELERTVTGYIVSMREESVLERQEKDHFVIVSDE